MMLPGDKLYVVVREDMSPGDQIAQAVHGAIEFCQRHPRLSATWVKASNTVAVLAVGTESELIALSKRCIDRDVEYAPFYEPDMGHSLTCLAIEPKGAPLVRYFPLALRLYGSPVNLARGDA